MMLSVADAIARNTDQNVLDVLDGIEVGGVSMNHIREP